MGIGEGTPGLQMSVWNRYAGGKGCVRVRYREQEWGGEDDKGLEELLDSLLDVVSAQALVRDLLPQAT